MAPRLHVLHLAPSIVQEHGDINLPGNEYTLQCIPSVFVQGDILSRERPIERVSGCSNAASTIAPYEARSTTCLESYRDPRPLVVSLSVCGRETIHVRRLDINMGDAHAFRRDTTVPDPNIEVFKVEIVFLMLMDWLMPLELCSVRTGSYQNHGLGGALCDGVGLPLWRLGWARGPGNPASMHMLIRVRLLQAHLTPRTCPRRLCLNLLRPP